MIDFSSRQLRAFVLVAQHHSFSRAAEALFITPSGLSLLIREFENQLGYRVFDRTTRHVALTAQGTELLATARRSLDDLDVAISRIGDRVKEARHTLTIGAGPSTAAYILPQALKEFRAHRPDLHIQVADDDPSTFPRKILDGSLDLALGTFSSSAGIRRTLFFRFTLIVIRPESEIGPRRSSTTWSALKAEPLIVPSFKAFRSVIEQHLDRAGVSSPPAMVLNRLDTIVGMVGAGLGTAIIPSFVLPACHHHRVAVSRLVADVAVTAHFTPGHTPGSTTWSWRGCEGEHCLDVVYADSLNPVSAQGFRFGGTPGHPGVEATLRKSIARVAGLPCDILLTVHPDFAALNNPSALLDPQACRAYADGMARRLDDRLQQERSGTVESWVP